MPAEWTATKTHTMALEFIGNRIGIVLDGQEYGYGTNPTYNEPGTIVGVNTRLGYAPQTYKSLTITAIEP